MTTEVWVEARDLRPDLRPVMEGRNGQFGIVALSVWISAFSGSVYIDGIGKRGKPIRGGFCIHPDTMDELAMKWCQARGLVPGLSAADVRMAREQAELWSALGEKTGDPDTLGCDLEGLINDRMLAEADLSDLMMQAIRSLTDGD